MLGIFLDSETNGLNHAVHRLIEIAYKMVDLTNGKEVSSYHSLVYQPTSIWEKSDPKSLQVTGLTLSQIQNEGKTEEAIRKEILLSFAQHKISRKNSVFICQNPSFDRVFFSQVIPIETQEGLEWPYHWLDLASMYWALSIKKIIPNTSISSLFPWETGLSKDHIASTLELPLEKKPHRALNGVDHLILCYTKLVGFPYALME